MSAGPAPIGSNHDAPAIPADGVDEREESALIDDAVALAERLLVDSLVDESRGERRRRERLGRLLADPSGRELILALTDEVLRLDDHRVAARRFAELVHEHRTSALGRVDAVMLRAGALVAPRVPRLVMPLVVRRVRSETHGIVLPAEDPRFGRHIARRTVEGVRLNVNPLGEAILSDAEADARLDTVLAKVRRSDVDYVSVKISAIVANLDALAFDHTVDRVADRLRTLYRTAEAASPRTFVNLDMEEYRDLELTLASFMRVLDEDEFAAVEAGIVLQAYLPDTHDAARRLGSWAVERHRRSGAGIKIRLVKGANLAMEDVDAELHGHVSAPYPSKADVDASYKRLLDSLLCDEWADAVRVGVASHNLFDVAWAIVRSRSLGATDRVEFEMLEGMAPAQARALLAETRQLLMYSPVVSDEDFDASIAYLSRRLDENTQPDNFLRSLFTLTPGSTEFARQATMFRASVQHRHTVSTASRRHGHQQAVGAGSRSASAAGPAVGTSAIDAVLADEGEGEGTFVNESDADTTDPTVQRAVRTALESRRTSPGPPIERVVTTDGIDAIVAAAASAAAAPVTPATRRTWLRATAAVMRSERFDTLALMASATGKTMHQGDPEVSEAIDFCGYYGTVGIGGLERLEADGLDVVARGVVAVVAPWNFPYAIPTGGVAAALAAGNAVILKPAPEAADVGRHIAEQFWRAGVPQDRLQLVVCDDGPIGTHLVTHPGLDTIILTGSYDTAAMFLDWRPDVRVLAETSGKNSLVITAAADLDLAIADLVNSAFGHAGQKCSAASLAIVEASVYDDPFFQIRLRDAVESLRVGAAERLESMIGPVIAAPTGPLLRALTTLEPGERWLVEPTELDDAEHPELAGRLWTPGVRVDVAPGSWFHLTECFGPVLGLVRADDLDHAIEIQNATDYGLTGGLHSLDPVEIERWLDRVQVGNAYVNRGTTGAIVQRQPFGGWKRSTVGGGHKAGGPGYVQQFATITDRRVDRVAAARRSFMSTWAGHFRRAHDPSGLRSESNVLRYVPLSAVALVHDGSDPEGLAVLHLAADVTGVRLVECNALTQPFDAVVDRLAGTERIRVLGIARLDEQLLRAAHELGIPVDTAAPVGDGFVELHRWVREQAVSCVTHRHGRVDEARRSEAGRSPHRSMR